MRTAKAMGSPVRTRRTTDASSSASAAELVSSPVVISVRVALADLESARHADVQRAHVIIHARLSGHIGPGAAGSDLVRVELAGRGHRVRKQILVDPRDPL